MDDGTKLRDNQLEPVMFEIAKMRPRKKFKISHIPIASHMVKILIHDQCVSCNEMLPLLHENNNNITNLHMLILEQLCIYMNVFLLWFYISGVKHS